MHKTFLITAAILGALAVTLGAFGAHGLKERANEYTLGIFETAVKYQFYHVFALLAVEGISSPACSHSLGRGTLIRGFAAH